MLLSPRTGVVAGVRFVALRAFALLAALYALPTTAANESSNAPARIVQGEFASAKDRSSFERALSKAFGSGVQLANPGDDTAGGDGVDDRFGVSVALSGDTALVGVNGDDTPAGSNAGSAYVFTRSGLLWTLQAQLTASDSATDDGFGAAVALSGDTALVGASFDDSPTDAAGSAYVFVRSGTAWTQQAKLVAGDVSVNAQFGISVALQDDTALIGAEAGGGGLAGAGYVFTRSGTVWTQQAQLLADDRAANDGFGHAVALSGDTALVGAFLDDAPLADAGSAYVFTRSGTLWTQQAQLTAEADVDYGDRFGVSVALSGDTALVGAYWAAEPSLFSGAAYVFTRSDTTWSRQAQLTATDGAFDDEFGISVALRGDAALVGAHFDDIIPVGDVGSAYLFTRNGTLWTQQLQFNAGDGAGGDLFGIAVALSADTALIGAHLDDSPLTGNLDFGSAWLFENRHVVTAQAVGNGSITPPTPSVLNTAAAEFTILPDPGHHIVSVVGDTCTPMFVSGSTWSAANITQPCAVTATFAINQYTLTYTAGSNGSISGTSPQTVNHGANGSAVAAIADGNHHFVDWSDGSTANPRTDVNVTDNVSVSANFAIDQYTLTYTANPNGSLNGTTPQTVNHGTSGTAVTAVPTSNHHFVDWSDASTANPRTDANVTGNLTVSASFAANTADLQIAKSDGAAGARDGDTVVYAITVTNAGPHPVQGVQVSDTLPAALLAAEWACLPAQSTAPCPAPPNDAGSGNLSALVSVPVGLYLRFDLSATIDGAPGNAIANTATVASPSPVLDSDNTNNSATDQTTVLGDPIFENGFESTTTKLTVPQAREAHEAAVRQPSSR